MKKHIVNLSYEEELFLKDILQKGIHTATVRNRVQILSLSGKGFKDEDISKIVGTTVRAIAGIRKRYCDFGIESTVYGKERSGRPIEFDASDEAEITALACSEAPEGYARWTLKLLKKHANKPMSKSTIHLILKKSLANLGDKRCGALERLTKNTEGGCIT